uniref:Uncharacterized protein n=1 Tax=viral metagenome TaxID=1070528 RepID=A0A6C0AK85_9ZZZZ
MSLKDEAQFAKRHIRNRFSLMVLPHVSDGIWSVYENAKTICEKNDQMDQVLKTFQNLLTRIPVWTDEVLQTEVKRIVAASKCSYLDELLTGVLLSYLRAFAAIQYRSTQDSVEVEFERPPLPRFIHEYYKEVARRCWEHAYLFRTIGVPTEQQARNRKQIEDILDVAFDTVLDSFLPWQSIVNTYFSVQDAPPPSADVIQPTETVVDAPSAPAPEPEKKVAFEHEQDEESDAEDLDEETDDEHPKIHLSNETLELDLGAVDEDEKKPEENKKEEEEDDDEVNLTPEEGEGLVLKV